MKFGGMTVHISPEGTTAFLRADGQWVNAIASPYPPFTPGSVIFADASGLLTEDNPNFFWDDADNQLGIGTNTPDTDRSIQVKGDPAYATLETTSTSSSNTLEVGAYWTFKNTTGTMGIIGCHTSTYSNPGTIFLANQATWESYGAGGMVVSAWGTGDIIFGTANGGVASTERFRIGATGTITAATAPVVSSLTAGRVLYAGTSKEIVDDSAFTWDATNDRLMLGTATTTANRDVFLQKTVNGIVRYYVQNSSNGTAGACGYTALNDAGTSAMSMLVNSSGYTTAGLLAAGDYYLAGVGGKMLAGTLDAQPFVVHTNGQATTNERIRADSAGNVSIGNAAIATNATDGFLYVPSCAGTPTGTPTAITGRIPIVCDSTNNKLYIYSGGAWVALN